MSSRRVMAVFRKQLKDTLKNKEVLIQFLMFPVLSVIMSNAMTVPDMPANFFVHMFATMYVGMAPLTCMSAVIAEEKEKNTLRVLMMSNVRGTEYLLGLGAYVVAVCMAGSLIFGLQGGYRGLDYVLRHSDLHSHRRCDWNRQPESDGGHICYGTGYDDLFFPSDDCYV